MRMIKDDIFFSSRQYMSGLFYFICTLTYRKMNVCTVYGIMQLNIHLNRENNT